MRSDLASYWAFRGRWNPEWACPPACVSVCEREFRVWRVQVLWQCHHVEMPLFCFFFRLWAFSSIYYTLRSATQWTLSQRRTMPRQTEQKLIFNVQKNSLKTVERIKASYSVSFQLFSFWLFCLWILEKAVSNWIWQCVFPFKRPHTHEARTADAQTRQPYRRVQRLCFSVWSYNWWPQTLYSVSVLLEHEHWNAHQSGCKCWPPRF